MSRARCCPYSTEEENCKFEIYAGQPSFDKCSTCDRVKTESKFDLKRVFNYDAVNKVKVGMKGFFADTVSDLRAKIEKEFPLGLVEILPKECLTRYRNENGFVYELFYPIGGVEIMNEILYCIENDQGNVVAKDMNMDTAMIMVRALFDHYYCENDIAFTIKRQNEIVKAVEE